MFSSRYCAFLVRVILVLAVVTGTTRVISEEFAEISTELRLSVPFTEAIARVML